MEALDDGFAFRKRPAKNFPVSLTLENVSPVTRLMEKKQEMLVVQQSLEEQKLDYQRKEELFKRREESLRKKDLELQEALVLFNKFLRENEHKRKRADMRAHAEMIKRNDQVKKINEKNEQLLLRQKELEKLKRQVKRNEKYLNFLTEVQSENEGIEGPTKLMDRLKLMEETAKELTNTLNKKKSERNELNQKFGDFKKEQHNRTLILNNDSTDYSNALTHQKEETSRLQERVILTETADSTTVQETYLMCLAIENLYQRFRKILIIDD
jgi:hypothetical protein